MKISHELGISQQRKLMISGFESMREGFLKHRNLEKTFESLLAKFEPSDPTRLMLFGNSGNCTPAGMSFCSVFMHENLGDSKILVRCMLQVIARVKEIRNLSYERQDQLVADLIKVIDKSGKAKHPGLLELKKDLMTLLPQQVQRWMAA